MTHIHDNQPIPIPMFDIIQYLGSLSFKKCRRVLVDWSCVVTAQAAFMHADMNYHGKQPLSGPVYHAGKQWNTEDEMICNGERCQMEV